MINLGIFSGKKPANLRPQRAGAFSAAKFLFIILSAFFVFAFASNAMAVDPAPVDLNESFECSQQEIDRLQQINENKLMQSLTIKNSIMWARDKLPPEIGECINVIINIFKIAEILAAGLSLIAVAIIALQERILGFVCEVVQRVADWVSSLVCIPLPDFGGVLDFIEGGQRGLDGLLGQLPVPRQCDGMRLVELPPNPNAGGVLEAYKRVLESNRNADLTGKSFDQIEDMFARGVRTDRDRQAENRQAERDARNPDLIRQRIDQGRAQDIQQRAFAAAEASSPQFAAARREVAASRAALAAAEARLQSLPPNSLQLAAAQEAVRAAQARVGTAEQGVVTARGRLAQPQRDALAAAEAGLRSPAQYRIDNATGPGAQEAERQRQADAQARAAALAAEERARAERARVSQDIATRRADVERPLQAVRETRDRAERAVGDAQADLRSAQGLVDRLNRDARAGVAGAADSLPRAQQALAASQQALRAREADLRVASAEFNRVEGIVQGNRRTLDADLDRERAAREARERDAAAAAERERLGRAQQFNSGGSAGTGAR